MSGEPSSASWRSARLAAKRAKVKRVDEDGATLSKPSVEVDAFVTTSGCQSTVKKRNVTCKSMRVAHPANELKTVPGDEVGENTRTKRRDRTQRVSRPLEDVEKPKRGRNKTTSTETTPKREQAVATKSPATAKRQRARAELASRETSRQAKRIRRRWRSTSRSSEASQGVASSSGSNHTAEDIASDTDITTPEQEDDTLPTPLVVEVETKLHIQPKPPAVEGTMHQDSFWTDSDISVNVKKCTLQHGVRGV
ncbi:hypothetical protein HPB52_019298 [Rhipicephalus sanguineus]|uniref:Uncharacterized protein n=1 Tax=Rhipicephalus sanguineus TaxID=34632 RepID=A0A9D4PDS5_RHISA|nr:hypothetical protein HPB52_019298 [Rhipicephalus sanguineus]